MAAVAHSSFASPVRSVREESSVVDQYRSLLIFMLGEEHLERVKELPQDTFDPLLWQTLVQDGLTRHHWRVYEELVPGYFWIQKTDSEVLKFCPYLHLPEVAIHWSKEPGRIYRAYLSESENQVIVELYKASIADKPCARREVSIDIEKFRKTIAVYAAQNANPKEAELQPAIARDFQRQIEQIPIIFKATRSACEQISYLRNDWTNDLFVTLGIVDKEEEFNPIVKHKPAARISKHFIAERLLHLHEREGNPEVTSERVAPVIWTADAYRDARKLRQWEELHQEETLIYKLDSERLGSRIMDAQIIADKSLKDLRVWFVLILDGFICEFHEFHALESKRSFGREFFELSVDFKDDAWHLQSQFFEKI